MVWRINITSRRIIGCDWAPDAVITGQRTTTPSRPSTIVSPPATMHYRGTIEAEGAPRLSAKRFPRVLGPSMQRSRSLSVAASLALILAGFLPIAGDFASCNAEAVDAVSARSSSAPVPNTKDNERAAATRRGEAPPSADSQLTGMDLEGAGDPAYQAAYRTCMRRRGF